MNAIGKFLEDFVEYFEVFVKGGWFSSSFKSVVEGNKRNGDLIGNMYEWLGTNCSALNLV